MSNITKSSMEFECNMVEGSLKRFIISTIPCCMFKVSEHVDAVGYRLSSEMQCGRLRKSQWWDSAGTTNTQIHARWSARLPT